MRKDTRRDAFSVSAGPASGRGIESRSPPGCPGAPFEGVAQLVEQRPFKASPRIRAIAGFAEFPRRSAVVRVYWEYPKAPVCARLEVSG
jgi:hypothetical protein